MALKTRERRPMTRLNNCDACGHYNWACTCEGAAAYHGSGEPAGGDILRGKQGLASCLLYRQKGLPMSQTCMCWGFDVDDGWFDILWMLSLALEDESKQTGAKIEAAQVKEKFGGLRFYTGPCTDRGYDLISMAETLSVRRCEVCGKHGKTCSSGHWLKTVCKEHAALLKYGWKAEDRGNR